MRTDCWLIAVALAMLCTCVSAAEPHVDSIDYDNPKAYLAIADCLGSRSEIIAQAGELKGHTDIDTLRNVLNWMQEELKYDGNKAHGWRNYDDVVREKAYGGCADEGVVCGALLKGAGIPTVWVKTMDVSWIWDFKKGRPFKSWSGHVFLEVFVDGQWMLLDPGGRMLYKHYSPQARILPGNRFAYDKGIDPKAMIMSLQWEEWKSQTEGFFRTLDVSMLPVDSQDTVALARTAYVIGNSPYYQVMTEMARESGFSVARSFNNQYDTFLPEARGHLLIVETHKGKPILPERTLTKHFPGAMQALNRPGKSIQVKNTTIVFIEFSEQLDILKRTKAEKAMEPANKPTGGGVQ